VSAADADFAATITEIKNINGALGLSSAFIFGSIPLAPVFLGKPATASVLKAHIEVRKNSLCFKWMGITIISCARAKSSHHPIWQPSARRIANYGRGVFLGIADKYCI
jgi:hypothetical protein